MRLQIRLLCFLTGHQPGQPFRLLGIELRSCRRCGGAVSGR
jgi:hypothetical protein